MFFAREEISFPSDLSQALSQALWNGNPGGELLRKRGSTLNKLWERLAKRRGVASEGETHYSFQRPEADAYSAYYLPANSLKAALVLEEARLLGLDLLGKNCRWLDLGTGPGTAFWGLAWWAKAQSKKIEFTGWDQSPLFAEIAENLTSRGPFGVRPRFLHGKKESAPQLVRKLEPTHVSFMNSINEIYPDTELRFAEAKKILSSLIEFSRKDGQPRYLLIIEPGSRDSSRELAQLKDRLQAELPARAILPCLDSRPCGALVKPTDWCHEEVACAFPDWLNDLGEEAGLRKESMLFSYALLRTGLEEPWAGGLRVVSQRLERKGQVECFLCTPSAKTYARAQRSKAGPESIPLLEASRGDIWKKADLGEKGDLLNAEVASPLEKSVFQF